jgi:hypothetical protein
MYIPQTCEAKELETWIRPHKLPPDYNSPLASSCSNHNSDEQVNTQRHKVTTETRHKNQTRTNPESSVARLSGGPKRTVGPESPQRPPWRVVGGRCTLADLKTQMGKYQDASLSPNRIFSRKKRGVCIPFRTPLRPEV